MPKVMSQKDFNDLVGLKCNLKPKTIEKVWYAIQDLIVSELQHTESITLQNFGKFTTVRKGGTDEWITNNFGKMEKKYIEPFDFVEFEPSKNFINYINTGEKPRVTRAYLNKMKNKDETLTYDKILDEIVFEKEVTDLIEDAMNFKRTKGEKLGKDKRNGRHIYCSTNDKKYRSVRSACIDLGIREGKMYYILSNGVTEFEVDGYDFKIIENDNDILGLEILESEVENES